MLINSKKIKQKAIDLGFHKVGIAEAKSTLLEEKRLYNWIDGKKNGSMVWINNRKEERGNIHKYYKDARSVISVALNYFTKYGQEDLSSDYKFSNYAWGDDYHLVLKTKLFSLFEWIKKRDKSIKGIVCTDTSPVMEKVWAQKSGLGWVGKHTNLITRDYGSWVFLGELILNIELDYDFAFDEDLCGTCTACIDSCPTQALEEYQIDSKKCISYLNIEKRGELSNDHDNLHGWIYGCDVCQEVCPWNIKFSQITNQSYFKPRHEIVNYTNNDWFNLDEAKFKSIFKNSSVKRTKYAGLKRNIKKNNKDQKIT